jgi:hypothetical protein
MALEMLGTRSSETLINGGLKIPNHGKRASCIGDGYLTVRDSQVPFLLGPEIRQMQFLKAQKKEENSP